MKTLVTGGAGFLGGECIRQLRAAGVEAMSTDRRGAADFAGDLSDPGFCATLPEADAVVHCAAVQYLSPDLPLFARAPYFRRNNVEATANLARRYAGKATHFVFVGSSMMYEQTGAASYSVGVIAKGSFSGTVTFSTTGLPSGATRSEERRVGKECA